MPPAYFLNASRPPGGSLRLRTTLGGMGFAQCICKTRLNGADHNRNQAVFLTICTKERRCVPSRIVGTGVLDCPQPELTRYGEIADKYVKQLNDFYEHLSAEKYVIIPNHIHLLIWLKENKTGNGQSRTPVPTNVERANR